MAQEEMKAAVAALGLSLVADFVPWSKSRNAKEATPSLNWRITIKRNGRDVVTTDYMQGSGHCAAYKAGRDATREVKRVIAYECERGRHARYMPTTDTIISGTALPAPDIGGVLYSLASDADVIDHATFEDWASEYGFDADSRAHEKMYRACLEIALKLRAGLGEDGLRMLRDACQGY